jgi:hypothetical protein
MSFLKTLTTAVFAVVVAVIALQWTYATWPQVVDPQTGDVLGPAHACPELDPRQPRCGVGQ